MHSIIRFVECLLCYYGKLYIFIILGILYMLIWTFCEVAKKHVDFKVYSLQTIPNMHLHTLYVCILYNNIYC